MRKPRSPMKVDTFPFLAVLLCAMGALIVVLLVMDRKARQVARQRAAEKAQAQQTQRNETQAQREADRLEREATALAEWQRKREQLKARVDAEQSKLEAELQAARQRAVDATRLLSEESARLQAARTKLAQEVQALQQMEKQIADADKAQASALQRLKAAEQARSTAATQLQSLERALAEAKRAPANPDKTFSLVPYGGKRGANSRPVYAECDRDAVIFHPEKKKIAASQTKELRAEAVRRLEARGEDAYLMILLRPEGIDAYYALRKTLDDLDVTYGYEMIDPDWQMDLSGEPKAPRLDPPAIATRPTLPPVPIVALGPAPVGNLVELPPLDRGDSRDGPQMGRPTPKPPGPLGLPTLSPPLVLGSPTATPTPSNGTTGKPNPEGKPNPDGKPKHEAKAGTPKSTGAQGATGEPPAGTAGGVAKTPTGEGGEPDTPTRLRLKQPTAKKEPLRAVRLESDEITVFVECYPESVVVYPSKKSFGSAAIANGNLLTQVKQGLSRPLLGGGTPKPQIRFLIRPGGERMLHLAVGNLRGLRVPMTQYTIQPEDDVQKIVTQR